jgi:hypothetical protein
VSEYDLENSLMRRPWLIGGCRVRKETKSRIIYFESPAGALFSLGNNKTEDISFVVTQTQGYWWKRINVKESLGKSRKNGTFISPHLTLTVICIIYRAFHNVIRDHKNLL